MSFVPRVSRVSHAVCARSMYAPPRSVRPPGVRRCRVSFYRYSRNVTARRRRRYSVPVELRPVDPRHARPDDPALAHTALSLQRTTLRTSRHPAHRAHPNTPPALLSETVLSSTFRTPHSAHDTHATRGCQRPTSATSTPLMVHCRCSVCMNRRARTVHQVITEGHRACATYKHPAPPITVSHAR